MAHQLVEEGEYFRVIVGELFYGEMAGKTGYQLVNKQYNVVEAEGLSEIQARIYLNHYEKVKKEVEEDGVEAYIGSGVEAPAVH